MCFSKRFKEGESTEPQVAKRNILVYKVIAKSGWGCYRNLYIDDKAEKWKKGFHYSETTPFKDSSPKKMNFTNDQIIYIEGHCFHSCVDEVYARHVHKGHNEKIVEMIIPKGALYYKSDKEYVSSEIIYPVEVSDYVRVKE